MTLEKIRAELPTHIILTPKVHRWREGDEVYVLSREGRKLLAAWEPKLTRDKFEVDLHAARRPIPPHILDNQALWLWLQNLEGVNSTPPMSEIVEAGLLPAWKNLLTKGRLYDKWLREQMEEI